MSIFTEVTVTNMDGVPESVYIKGGKRVCFRARVNIKT